MENESFKSLINSKALLIIIITGAIIITSNHLVKLGQQNGLLPLGKKDSNQQ
jgi:hypothetical protein